MIYTINTTINKITGKKGKTTVLYPKPLLTEKNNYSLGHYLDTDKNLFLISKYDGLKFYLDFELSIELNKLEYNIKELEEYINGKFDV